MSNIDLYHHSIYNLIMFEITTNKIYLFSRSTKKSRISEIDIIRGICIILMIVDHFFLIFGTISKMLFTNVPTTSPMGLLRQYCSWWWNWDFRINARIFVLCVFFFISGVSSAFSRNNIRRGIWIVIVSLIINCVMFGAEVYLGFNGMLTYFGAINSFGTTILIFALYEWLMNKLKIKDPYRLRITLIIGLVFSLIGFTATTLLGSFTYVSKSNVDFITFIEHALGFTRISSVGDYLPLLPYFGFFFFGAGFAAILYKNKESIFSPLYKYIPEKPIKSNYSKQYAYYLSWSTYITYSVYNSIIFLIKKTGRYSLIVYLLHQFVLILILIIVMYSLGYSIQF